MCACYNISYHVYVICCMFCTHVLLVHVQYVHAHTYVLYIHVLCVHVHIVHVKLGLIIVLVLR